MEMKAQWITPQASHFCQHWGPMRGEATRTQSTSGGEVVEPLGSVSWGHLKMWCSLLSPPPPEQTSRSTPGTSPALLRYSAVRTPQTPQMSLNKGVGIFHTVTGWNMKPLQWFLDLGIPVKKKIKKPVKYDAISVDFKHSKQRYDCWTHTQLVKAWATDCETHTDVKVTDAGEKQRRKWRDLTGLHPEMGWQRESPLWGGFLKTHAALNPESAIEQQKSPLPHACS